MPPLIDAWAAWITVGFLSALSLCNRAKGSRARTGLSGGSSSDRSAAALLGQRPGLDENAD